MLEYRKGKKNKGRPKMQDLQKLTTQVLKKEEKKLILDSEAE